MLPTVTFNDDNEIYKFTLLRDNKKQVHQFKRFSVSVNDSNDTVIHGISSVGIYEIDESVLEPHERPKFDGPAFDGKLYYISAQPFEGDEIFIWLSKEEFQILQPMLDDIEEEKFQKLEYQFTRTTLKDMAKNPSNYGPQQRARAMVCCPVCQGALVGLVYSPHCGSCDWDSQDDSHNAYRQHPLDHE